MLHKIAIVLAAVIVTTSTVALAQLPIPLPLPSGTPEDRAACEPDVQRHCRAAIPDQLRVLACLQDNRSRISRACQGVLVRYGQ
ncbi:MAG: cysteine rich repeat-containing protein [Xanthobacteraceae bacterium]|nr:cysteine rich repeat-containing protein [Xanthobacteraceae bacterium]